MTTYLDIETAIEYWSVSWKFVYSGAAYEDDLLSEKEGYGQSECMRDSIGPVLDQANDLYSLLVKEEERGKQK